MNDMDREFLEENDKTSFYNSNLETEINRRRVFHNGIALQNEN